MMLKRTTLRLLGALALGGVVMGSAQLAKADVFTRELERALLASEQIKASHKAYLSAREELVIAHAGSEWSSSMTLDQTRSNQAVKGDEFSRSDSRNLTLQVKKKLYDGGVSSAQETVALLQLDLAMNQVAMTEENVLLAAVQAYTGLSSARDRLRISTANLARLDEHLRAATLKLEIGESSATEFSGTKARHARAMADRIQSENNLATAEATYISLIGTPPVTMNMPAIPANLPLTTAAAAKSALDHKPGHHISYLTERITRKTMDVLLAQVRPNLDLTLSGKTTDATSNLMDKETASANITFSMPLYPSTSVFAKSRGAAADHQKSLHDLSENRRTTVLTAENAFRSYQAATAVINAYEAELNAAAAVRDGTIKEVKFGQKSVLDQLDAEQDVVNAQLNLLVARHDQVISAYTLLSASGLLTPSGLALTGQGTPAEAAPIDNPIVGPFPLLRYPE
ncbi:MAG: TolC family protein [Alphaproteobacteria bacterium]|nr:TolC family protein [Alphaproteobacteria bacterium]